MTSNLVGAGDCKVLANSLSHELYKGILAATDGCKASVTFRRDVGSGPSDPCTQ